MKIQSQKCLFFVMGIQRSGGSTLLNAFKRNRSVSIFREKDKNFFDYFILKPEKELRPFIEKSKSLILIEAKSETKKREVVDIFNEFSNYIINIIWNYRNPVNVFYSRLIKYPYKDWVADENQFCDMWNQRNSSIINALDQYRDNIAIVKLEDLSGSKSIFKQLCEFVGTKGRYTFYRDKIKIEKKLSASVIDKINNQTASILNKLDANRRFILS
jgi:hypothetical protein